MLVIAASISASLGCGFSLRSAATAMIMPLWQYPHCGTSWAIQARCTGCRSPFAGSPSIVVICAPSAALTGTKKLMIVSRSRTNRTTMIALLHFRPRVPLAWRILTYDKRRTGLALIGIFMAILLVFVELGFFYAVPRGGLLLYDNMRFDLLLASNEYEYQAQPGAFPLDRLNPVRSSPDVAKAVPVYFGFAKWKSGEGGMWPDV